MAKKFTTMAVEYYFWGRGGGRGKLHRNSLLSIYLFPGDMINYSDCQH